MAEPIRYVAVVKVTGEDMCDLARRLEDIASQLDEQPFAAVREIVSDSFIAVVRPEGHAPFVDWVERA